MKSLRIIMLIIGILAFGFGTLNIVLEQFSNDWFGFISGAFLIWLYFNIENIVRRNSESK